MDLEKLGWKAFFQTFITEKGISLENVARVAVENRGGYLLYSSWGELEGIVRRKFVRETEKSADLPKVGDWVLIEKLSGEAKAVIKEVLPRKTKISRKQAGEEIAEQVIAANVDLVFIVQGLDDDFNLQRAERYVAMTKEGGSQPIILLNKCDLAEDAAEKLELMKNCLQDLEVFLISAKTGQGIEKVRALIEPGLTVVFVGSSGVGKSTLVNALTGLDRQKTQQVRLDDSRGRHTTTKRELVMLPNGGLLIDTPGMRELGLWASQEALDETFDDIGMIARRCKFNDCDHVSSAGCAVLEALSKGEIERDKYERYIKLNEGLDFSAAAKKRKDLQVQKRSRRGLEKRPYYTKKK